MADVASRPSIKRQFLRWLLHSLWCVKNCLPPRVCNEPRCIQLRPIVRHIIECDNENCIEDHCKIAKETKGHWDGCKRFDCEICCEMYVALKGRLLPDKSMNPNPNIYMTITTTGRTKMIKKM
ncbi:unnamed protein product [Rodentolepis nana]|uniref:TAZ-type domain-containing protein n=1 Tax=Rodentolepis nana TaxID=102285 RepID=A0A0R3T1T9_RODNA|nr:unnamed protein product [Rodentolepis nana]